MTPDEIQRFADRLSDVTSFRVLWNLMLDYFHCEGFDKASYHFHDETHPVGAKPALATDGFPEEWVCAYIEKSLVFIDPIMAAATQANGPFLWSQVTELMKLSPEQQNYISRRSVAVQGDGLAVYVHGPKGNDALVGLGFGPERIGASPTEVFRFQCIAQIGHLKYCEIAATRRDLDKTLSTRERQVLVWIARGKSNADIADILYLSRHTVDTLTRRIFAKLEVRDRTTAAVKAVGSGLVQYSTMGVA